jgi:hypothetical protein
VVWAGELPREEPLGRARMLMRWKSLQERRGPNGAKWGTQLT